MTQTMERLEFTVVDDAEGLRLCLDALRTQSEIALDTETAFPRNPVKAAAFKNVYSLLKGGKEYAPIDPHTAEVRLMQMKGETTGIFVVDLWALPNGALDTLAAFIQGYTGTWILHNAKFDVKMIYGSLRVWLDYKAKLFCTMQASILLSNSVGMGGEKGRGHRLLDNARDFLDVDLDKTEQASDWSQELTPEQLEYAAADVTHLHALKAFYWDTLVEKLGQVEPVELEMQVIGPVARMEWNGVPFNPVVYRKVQEAARYTLPDLLSKVGYYFKETLGTKLTPQRIPITREDGTLDFRTYRVPYFEGKSGDALLNAKSKILAMLQEMGFVDDEGEPIENTQKATLEVFRKEHPGVGYLLDYWALLKQTQFDYESWVHPLTKRLHPKLTPGGASTGRFSCTSPNLQQVPELTGL